MHVSLDSALGQQRRLNQVGQTISSIATPTVAYSLRSLTGGDPRVVRVRRESDNHEQDFTASEVSSGALTSFVNAQVTLPLDIQELTATGRDGNFLIPKAAYSLRSLGTRQATVTSSGDTDGDTSGKFVCQVRRSSDDKIKSFIADEITDGTLLAFTNADYAKYTSDFSSGDDSWGAFDDVTETGNIDGIGGLDDNLRLAIGSATSQHRAYRSSTLPVGQKINFSARVFIPSTNSGVDGVRIRDANGTVIIDITTPTQDQWVTVTASNVSIVNAQLRVDLVDGSATNFTGNGSDEVYLREITVTQVTSDGLVKTWYDQSVSDQAGNTPTGNHVTQGTAATQPKIVNAGSLITGGLRFDDAQKLETAGTFSFGDATTLSTFLVNSSDKDETSYLFRFGTDYILFHNSAGLRRVNAGSTANAGTASGSDELWSTISTLNSSGGTTNFFVDGTLASSADASIGTNTVSSKVLNIGGTSSGTHWNGTVNEVIFYDTDQTNNRTAIDANIGEAYNLNLPAGVDPLNNEVNGFVETWYDQFGSNNAVQAVAGSQPRIVNEGSLTKDSNGIVEIDFNNKFFNITAITAKSVFALLSANTAATGSNKLLPIVSNTTTASSSYIFISNNQSPFNGYAISLDGNISDSGSWYLNGTFQASGGNLGNFGDIVSGQTMLQTIIYTPASDPATTVNTIGKQGADDTLDGTFKELILYSTNQSSSVSALNTNIKNHYGIS